MLYRIPSNRIVQTVHLKYLPMVPGGGTGMVIYTDTMVHTIVVVIGLFVGGGLND